MKKIEQLKVSHGVRFFKQGLMERWDLRDYYDINKPCLFFNINNQDDINVVKNHKGFKLIHFVNARGNQFIDKLTNIPDLVVNHNPYLKIIENIKYKYNVNFEIKDYSPFKPNILGDRIYCYVGNDKRKELYGYDLAKEIQKRIKFKILFGLQGGTIEHVKKNYYDNCFLNLNLEKSGGGGRTTLFELSLMGRKTIMNTKFNYESVIPYDNIDDAIDIITNESNKIGTLQKSINVHNVTDEWIYVDFWYS